MLSTGDVHLPQVRPPLPPCDAQLTARKQSEDKNSSVRFPLSTRRDKRRERSLQLSFPLSLFQAVVISRVGGGWGLCGSLKREKQISSCLRGVAQEAV